MNKKNLPFQIITLALFIGLIVPVAIQDGMFMDGLIYACIAKNLANGLGTFWDPHFSASFMTSYHEQPPLFFGLESIFFRLFGDSIYVERAFSLLLGCITAYFIHLIWKLIHRSNSDIQQASWFPILLWTITPVCFWGYAYNVEETIMGTFAAGSVYFILQAITKNSIPYLVLGGLFIFLSSFCKGIQGLFPITSVFIYWLITKNISLKKMLSFSIILIAIPTVIYLLLFTHDAVIASYSAYFQDRLVGTFQKEHIATTTNRLYLLYRLLCELLPAIALCIVITIINIRYKSPKLTNPNLKTAFFFI
ncbi:MAG: glycosyltransferase family 39 protein, partial [Bacteroidia bacterium]|nr:glycosyltransferase family 39 protein [Bacteroidia bacterium]